MNTYISNKEDKGSRSCRKIYRVYHYLKPEKFNVNNDYQNNHRKVIVAQTISQENKQLPKLGSLQEDLILDPKDFLLFNRREGYKEMFLKKNIHKSEARLKKAQKAKIKLNESCKQNSFSTKSPKIVLNDSSETKKKSSSNLLLSKEIAEQKFTETFDRINSSKMLFSTFTSLSDKKSIERLRTERDFRVFDRFSKYENDWKTQKEKIDNLTKRSVRHNSLIDKQSNFREKKEILTALENCSGQNEVKNFNYWKSSLRNYKGEKLNDNLYVAVGWKNNPIWMKILDGTKGIIDQKIRVPTKVKLLFSPSYKDSMYFKSTINRIQERLDEVSPCRNDQIEGLTVEGISKLNLEFSAFKKMDGPIKINLKSKIEEEQNNIDEEIF